MATRYKKEVLEDAVNKSNSVMGVMRLLGVKMAGGSHSHLTKRIKDFGIDTSHFWGMHGNTGTVSPKRKAPSSILIVLPEGSSRPKRPQILRAMKEVGIIEKCSLCGGKNFWNGLSLTLEIDHVDGNWLNNLIENLRFLCPNCHSQQKETNAPHKNNLL